MARPTSATGYVSPKHIRQYSTVDGTPQPKCSRRGSQKLKPASSTTWIPPATPSLARETKDPQITAPALALCATVLLTQGRRKQVSTLTSEVLACGHVQVAALLEL